jgi:hypothetical protein
MSPVSATFIVGAALASASMLAQLLLLFLPFYLVHGCRIQGHKASSALNRSFIENRYERAPAAGGGAEHADASPTVKVDARYRRSAGRRTAPVARRQAISCISQADQAA